MDRESNSQEQSPLSIAKAADQPALDETLKNIQIEHKLDADEQINEYLTDFASFTSVLQLIREDKWGQEEDSTSHLLNLAVNRAQSSFFNVDEKLLDVFLKHVRAWVVHMLKIKQSDKITPCLELLMRLPLTDELLLNNKFINPIKHVFGSPGKLGIAASSISRKFPTAFKNTLRKAPPPPKPQQQNVNHIPKLFGLHGALQLNTHKRPRSPDLDQSKSTTESNNLENEDANEAKKRKKSLKSVHWKDDDDLVEVRFYEINGTTRFKSSKSARLHEFKEGSNVQAKPVWHHPVKLEFSDSFKNFELRSLMSISRGGTLLPESEFQDEVEINFHLIRVDDQESEKEKEKESPDEPPAFETEPESDWVPKTGGTFKAAQVPMELLHKYPSQQSMGIPGMGMPMNFMQPSMNLMMNPMASNMPNMPNMPMMGMGMGWMGMGMGMGMGYPTSQDQMTEYFNKMQQNAEKKPES